MRIARNRFINMSTEPEHTENDIDEVDKDQLESLLRSDLLGINDLRDIVENRDLNVTARRTDKLVDAILADKWTSDEFDELKKELAQKEEETGPKGYYIQSISSIDRLTDRPLHEEYWTTTDANTTNILMQPFSTILLLPASKGSKLSSVN